MRRQTFLIALLLICLLLPGQPVLASTRAAQASCTFSHGFKTLHDLIPAIVGDCLEDEHFETITRKAIQWTTGGLLVWRKLDNWTAFTDGATSWINGPEGLVSRPNLAPTFRWEVVAPPGAGAATEFYSGKTIRIVVGFSPGGGLDNYTRLLARHLNEYIPGNPTFLIQNEPGDGSLLAADSVYRTAPKDGTVIVGFSGELLTQKYLRDNRDVTFDPLQYNYLGSPAPATPACAVTKESGFTGLDQARVRELVLGGVGPAATTDEIPKVLKSALGLNIRLRSGYQRTARVRLAADNGEIHGGCWAWESMSKTWKDRLDKGEVLVLAQGGPQPHPDLGNVPMMQSFAADDGARQLIEAGITTPGQVRSASCSRCRQACPRNASRPCVRHSGQRCRTPSYCSRQAGPGLPLALYRPRR